MNSTTSNGQQRATSSIRTEGGPNIEATLALGKKLAEYAETHDLTGNWMAHHLAALIEDAKDGSSVTVEQRIEIVETILKLWMNRRAFPGRFPGQEFEHILAGLELLGDDTPWRFSRLGRDISDLPDPRSTELPLVSTAAELERLTRETVVSLLLVAHNEAMESGGEWVDAARKANAQLEGELSTVSALVGRRLREYHGLPIDEALDPESETPAQKSLSKSEVADQLSDYNHARRLRQMAALLLKVASALYPEAEAESVADR